MGRANGEHLREIAEKLRRLAQQTAIAEAREELFDLADQLDWMAERAKNTRTRPSGRAPC
jgi:hypothetical protein